MKAGVRSYEGNFALGSFVWGGEGGGREQTPCIEWWDPNGYGFKAILV